MRNRIEIIVSTEHERVEISREWAREDGLWTEAKRMLRAAVEEAVGPAVIADDEAGF